MAEEEAGRLSRLINTIVRIQNVILEPDSEWTAIAEEPSSLKEIYGFYVVPLATISPVASFVGSTYLSTFRTPVITGVCSAITSYAIALISVFILSLVINGLALVLRDHNDKIYLSSLKIIAYSYIPIWLAGMFLAIPVLGFFAFVLGLQSLYLLYIGLRNVLKIPEWKAGCYAAVVTAGAIAFSFMPIWINSHWPQWIHAVHTWSKIESLNQSTSRRPTRRAIPAGSPRYPSPVTPDEVPEEPPLIPPPSGKPRPAPIVPPIHPEDGAELGTY